MKTRQIYSNNILSGTAEKTRKSPKNRHIFQQKMKVKNEKIKFF
jgi:hypothetical protein